jgi:uncharacterized protein (TIGR03089 family)
MQASLACAGVEDAGAGFQSFRGLAERQAGRHADKPFLTWYDDDRGERVELSFRTFGNWVAKVANLLVEELGVERGDRVAAVLVEHWQAAVVLAACWRAGAGVVVVDPDAAPAARAAALGGVAAAFVREEWVAEVGGELGGAGLVALTADLLGRSQRDLGSALRFARVVPSMPDHFLADPGDPPADALSVAAAAPPPAGGREAEGTGGAAQVEAGGPAAEVAGGPAGAGVTMAGLLEEAGGLVARTGLGEGDRLLCGLGLLRPAGAAAGLLAPFGAGAGVVLARAFQPARFWKRVADEHVTVAVLDPAQAEALLAAGPPPDGRDRARLRTVACQPAGAGERLRAGWERGLGVPLAW